MVKLGTAIVMSVLAIRKLYVAVSVFGAYGIENNAIQHMQNENPRYQHYLFIYQIKTATLITKIEIYVKIKKILKKFEFFIEK